LRQAEIGQSESEYLTEIGRNGPARKMMSPRGVMRRINETDTLGT
jgi:hypothetical protein